MIPWTQMKQHSSSFNAIQCKADITLLCHWALNNKRSIQAQHRYIQYNALNHTQKGSNFNLPKSIEVHLPAPPLDNLPAAVD